jgi:polysaccharide pyruvyl transferase CsaB
VVIQGWYGNGNLGDEIVLECMLTQLRKELPGASFLVVSDNPEDTRRRHGVKSIRRGGGRFTRLRRLMALTRADLFVLGGGGLLKSYGSSELSVLTWLGALDLAHEMGVPTMAYAVGVSDGFTPRTETVIRDILSGTDAVLVRDEPSLQILKKMGVTGVRVTADPSVLLPQLHPEALVERGNPLRPAVSVFLNHWFVSRNEVPDRGQWDRFRRSLAESLDFLISNHSASVTFVPMQIASPGDDDRVVAQEVRQLMTQGDATELVEGEVTPEDLLRIVSGSNLVLAMRLHSLIMAAATGVPVISLAYHPKVTGFAGSIGIDGWVLEIGSCTSLSIENLALRGLSGDYPLSVVKRRVTGLQREAAEAAKIAAELVRRPKSANTLIVRTAKGCRAVFRRLLKRKKW